MRVGANSGNVIIQLPLYQYAAFFDLVSRQFQGVFENVIYIQEYRTRLLRPGKIQYVTNNFIENVNLFYNFVDIIIIIIIIIIALVGQFPLK